MKLAKLIIAAALLPFAIPVAAQQQGSTMGMNNGMMAEGLLMPEMDAGKGRTLFC